jgi:hypothetical protein
MVDKDEYGPASAEGQGFYYIDLVYENFSTYKIPNRKPWGEEDKDVVTKWYKIRFDPETMLVHTGDFTYTDSEGYCGHFKELPDKIPFGTAFGCESTSYADGTAKIDLRGTGYAVDDTFNHSGYYSAGNATYSHNDQVVDLVGGGYCGWIAPSKCYGDETKSHLGGWYIKLKKVEEKK